MKLFIISGRSGSGKSVCLHALEDLGFYCIDNLPLTLLPAVIEELLHLKKIAVGVDARNPSTDLNQFSHILKNIKKTGKPIEVIFLDANEQSLLQRFSETRRKHPLSSQQVSLKEALEKENDLLAPIASHADLHVDTTRLSVQQLRELIRQRVSSATPEPTLSLLFESFGYKYGIPNDTDFVFDVRCLPNPYWQPHLRNFTGLDKTVGDFLQQHLLTKQLIKDIKKFLATWIPQSTNDMRSYLTIAIGCTGGQHRSVYVTEQLAKYFRKHYQQVQVRHREL